MKEMTDQEMRIAIAEFVFKKRIPPSTGQGEPNGIELYPEYPNDLNAMHEVEKTLTGEQREQYLFNLHTTDGSLYWQFLHMTARQRAEAFLRTIGKWKDS